MFYLVDNTFCTFTFKQFLVIIIIIIIKGIYIAQVRKGHKRASCLNLT